MNNITQKIKLIWKKSIFQLTRLNFKSRLLIKNALQSVWTNKGQVISLMAIVFLGATIYSLLDTTVIRIDNSYEIVSENSSPHDFIVSLDDTQPNLKYASKFSKFETKSFYVGDVFKQDVLATVQQELVGTDAAFTWTYKHSRLFDVHTNDKTILQKAIMYDSQATVDQLYVFEGKTPSGRNVVINPGYAKAHHLDLGDTITVSGAKLTICGFGTSADFITPIVDQTEPIPDQKNNLLIYSDPTNFDYIHDKDNPRFWTYNSEGYHDNEIFAPTSSQDIETSFNGRFKNQNLSDTDLNKALTLLNQHLQNYFDYNSGGNRQLVFGNADPSYNYYLRDHFFDAVLSNYRLITTLLLIVVLVISAFLVGLITQKRLAHTRRQIGILKALGYGDFSIITSFLIWPLLAAVFGTIIGYFVGVGIQAPLLSIFFGYFTLPALNFILPGTTFAAAFLITFGFLALITIVTCFIFIRGKTMNLLKLALPTSTSQLGLVINRLNHKRSFMVRLKYSLLSKSIGKIVIAFCALLVSTVLVSLAVTIPKSLFDLKAANEKSSFQTILRYDAPIFNSPFSFYRLGIDVPNVDKSKWFAEKNGEFPFNPGEQYQDQISTWTLPDYYTPHLKAQVTGYINQTWSAMTGYWRNHMLPTLADKEPAFSLMTCEAAYPTADDWNKYFDYSTGKITVDFKDLPADFKNIVDQKTGRLVASQCITKGARKQMPYFMRQKFDANPDKFSSFIGLVPYQQDQEELATSFTSPIKAVLKADGTTIKHKFSLQKLLKQKQIENYGIWADSKLVKLKDKDSNNLLTTMINDPEWQSFLKSDNPDPLAKQAATSKIIVPVVINQTLSDYLDIDSGDYLLPNINRKTMMYADSKKLYNGQLSNDSYKPFSTTVTSSGNNDPDYAGWKILNESMENLADSARNLLAGQTFTEKNSTSVGNMAAKMGYQAEDFNYTFSQTTEAFHIYKSYNKIRSLFYPNFNSFNESLMHALVATNLVRIQNEAINNIEYKVVGIQDDYSLPRIFMLKPFADYALGYNQAYGMLKTIFAQLANPSEAADPDLEYLPAKAYSQYDQNKKIYQYLAPTNKSNQLTGVTNYLFPIFNTKFSALKTPDDLNLTLTTHQRFGDYTKPGLAGGQYWPTGTIKPGADAISPVKTEDEPSNPWWAAVCNARIDDITTVSDYNNSCHTLGQALSTRDSQSVNSKADFKNYAGYNTAGVDSVFGLTGYEQTIDNTTQLINIIVYAFIVIAVLISIVMIAVTANIIIFENQRTFATLKVMGYKNREILRVTMGMYLAPLLLALGIGFVTAWFSLGNVYGHIAQASAWAMPLMFNGLLIVIAFAIIIIAFLLSFIGCWQFLKNINANQALKVDED